MLKGPAREGKEPQLKTSSLLSLWLSKYPRAPGALLFSSFPCCFFSHLQLVRWFIFPNIILLSSLDFKHWGISLVNHSTVLLREGHLHSSLTQHNLYLCVLPPCGWHFSALPDVHMWQHMRSWLLLEHGKGTRNHKTALYKAMLFVPKYLMNMLLNKRNSNTILLVYISVHKVDAQTTLAQCPHT